MVTDMQHPASLSVDMLMKSCLVRRQRRSGPGGQHRNKVETGIFIEHTPSGLRAESTEQRSQPRNLEQAIFRLRVLLAIKHRTVCDSRTAYEPSPLWMSRLRGGRIEVNERHSDFPAILAEALDVLACYHWDPKEAKLALHCSASQLIKLLKKDPRAFSYLNLERSNLGLSALH